MAKKVRYLKYLTYAQKKKIASKYLYNLTGHEYDGLFSENIFSDALTRDDIKGLCDKLIECDPSPPYLGVKESFLRYSQINGIVRI